jgi:hypothetical protein
MIRTFAAHALQQTDRFDELGFGETVLAFAKSEIGGNQSGSPRERKAREMAKRPTCELVASSRGRASSTKGVL